MTKKELAKADYLIETLWQRLNTKEQKQLLEIIDLINKE